MKHLPVAGEGERGGGKGDVRGGASAREIIEKSRYVRVIVGRRSEGITQSNSSSPGNQNYLLSPRGGDGNLIAEQRIAGSKIRDKLRLDSWIQIRSTG